MGKKLLTFAELRDHGILLGRKQIRRLAEKGSFPKPVRIGEHRIGWVADEIKAYVDGKIKERTR